MARSVTFAHIGETEDQVRTHFKSPPIDQGRGTVRRTDEPKAPAKEATYLVFLENGWLVWIDFCEGKSVTETWSKTSVANWTSQPIPSQDIENLRKEYGMEAISSGLWGNPTVWMRYDERHKALMIAPYDFNKPVPEVWPRLPTWWYRENAREFRSNKSEVVPATSPPPTVAVTTPTAFPSLAAMPPAPSATESPQDITPTPSPTPKRLTLVQIAAKISPSVVTLTAYNSEGEKLKTGTGFFVHPTGGIATNWHVISGASRVTARISTGDVLEVVAIGRYDPKLDLALCSVSQTGERNFPSFATYLKKLPPMGTRLAVLGNPEGLEQSLSEGIVSAIRNDDAGTLIQITAPISPGSSGSPVVDDTGSLVGVAGATYREGQNLNFARSALDLAAIWHDLRPQTLAEVDEERVHAFVASDLVKNLERADKANNVREKIRLAFAIREAYPEESNSYAFTGDAFVLLRDYEHAIAEFEHARLLFPKMAYYWERLGELYTEVGQTDRARECISRAKQLHIAEAKKSDSPSVTLKPPSAGNHPATDVQPGASVSRVNGADCHIVKYKAGWKEGDLINTRTGPGQNYSVANKIAIGEKGLVMEFQTTSNRGTPWVRVFRWDNDKKNSATLIGWANKNFFQFDK